MYPWIAKFEHLVATLANEVVVLAETISLFVMAGILPELMAFHQPGVDEQIERIVYRCPAHLIATLLHLQEQGIDVEMGLVRIDFVEYGVALRCFALT